MQSQKRMSVRARVKSFKYAVSGIRTLMISEPNASLHAAATVLAIIAGFYRHLSSLQWITLIFAIGLVWITEAFNTCIEKLCDYSCNKEIHPTIKIIKDVSAAAVLIAAAVSVFIGIIIFF